MYVKSIAYSLIKLIKLLDKFDRCVQFINSFVESMDKRLENIKDDKLIKKQCELRRQAVPDSVLWNISQENRVHRHIDESFELLRHIQDRLKHHEELAKSRIYINDVMLIQNQVRIF